MAIIGAGGIGRDADRDARAARRRDHRRHALAAATGRCRSSASARSGARADHFVICAPATDDTRHLVGAAELCGDEAALLDRQHRPRLADRHRRARRTRSSAEAIGGAALDVTDPEPLPDGHPLWASPRALITPHVANPPSAMDRDLAKRVAENVRRFAAGEELLAPSAPTRLLTKRSRACSISSSAVVAVLEALDLDLDALGLLVDREEVLDLGRAAAAGCRRGRSRPLQCGSSNGTQMILSSWPRSSVIRSTAIARTSITQPGNVGSPTSTIASSASPSSPSVSGMKP